MSGFTLLEVMCALAILGLVTSLITEMCHTAYEQGTTATDLRDLREAADTVFRRLAYEDGRHQDGLRATLDDFYAGWAELPSLERDRWRPYVMEFHRRPRTAAGEPGANGAEPIGGSSSSRRSSGRGGSGSSGTGTGGTGTGGTGTGGTGTGGTGTGGTGGGASTTDEETPGIELMQLTLTIWHQDEPNDHLIVLQTFITPQGDGTKTGSGSGGTGSR